ncbi:MAG: hypothetical protein FWD64_03275 [Acidobacteriaceae bacterium]|nr:hypothetical protein [Acidobacteriaceae bacterium]
MTIHVELNAETEARLAAAAEARGIALEKYVGTLLREALAAAPSGSGKMTVDDLRKMLGEIAEGAEKLPYLPTSAFTRESFYEGRL